jgi:hypothetical protein
MSDRYKYHPAYHEGRNAFVEGIRRGQNPYSATGNNQTACLAWWAGWDFEFDDDLLGDDPGHEGWDD